MRTFAALLGLSLAVILSQGCSSSEASKTTAAAQAAPSAGTPCRLQTAGRDVLILQAPAEATCKNEDGAVHIRSRDGYVDVWQAPAAKSLPEAVASVPDRIKSEFKSFTQTATTDLTVAGTPAKRLAGSGVEADDNDPGTADVVVFQAGGSFFIACTHGESISNSARETLLAVVRSAHTP